MACPTTHRNENIQCNCVTGIDTCLEHDTDLTFMNSLLGGDKNVATQNMHAEVGSPQLDADGNIQSAQHGHENETHSQSMCSYIGAELDDAVIDRLDKTLFGLTKDLYISTLLDETDASVEMLINYRIVLSTRAKSCGPEGVPFGTLKERRRSSKATVADKYAIDCYHLQLFLDHSISLCDIEEIYRRPPPTPAHMS